MRTFLRPRFHPAFRPSFPSSNSANSFQFLQFLPIPPTPSQRQAAEAEDLRAQFEREMAEERATFTAEAARGAAERDEDTTRWAEDR